MPVCKDGMPSYYTNVIHNHKSLKYRLVLSTK